MSPSLDKDPASIRVIAPNFNPRFSGVTASIIAVIPALEKFYPICTIGKGIPDRIPQISWWDFLCKCRRGPWRIWHARRNIEMLVGIILRIVFRYRLILLWTSAAQRRHTWLTRLLYRQMDFLIATTKAAASYLDKPAVVVNHGVAHEIFFPPEDRQQIWNEKQLVGEFGIGIFGRVRPQKGTEEFVEALCTVLPQYPRWTGVIIGETTPKFRPFRQRLEEKIRNAGLEKRIVFIGKVEDFAEIPVWYRAMSLVITPPWVEGFGLTCLEAMASGCPVIATRTGAFPEIIEVGKNGWLADCRDCEGLIDALHKALRDPHRIHAMGISARQHIEEFFSIEKEAENIARVYRDAFAKFAKEENRC